MRTKWRLIGIAVFIGPIIGIWHSTEKSIVRPSVAQQSTSGDTASEMSKLAERCERISDFAERFDCEKPVRDWEDEQQRKKEAARLAAEAARLAEAEKRAAEQRRAQAYEAYRKQRLATEKVHEGLATLFRVAAIKRALSYEDHRRIDAEINLYYRSTQTTAANASSASVRREIREELANVDVMPFESGANLILKYLGQVDESAIRKAIRDLRIARAIGKPELIGAMAAGSSRQPLFPDVPTMSAPTQIGSIDNKPPTPEEERTWQRSYLKWELQRAIIGIYKDCEEHFRPLYTRHLQALFQYYISNLTKHVDATPQNKTYPLYLLGEGATPNERLGGALVVLWHEQLTPLARQRVVETPQEIFANGCPSERRRFNLVGSSRLPEQADIPTFGRKFEELTRSDVPILVQTLKTAYARCRPSIRSFYVDHMQLVATRLVALQGRRGPRASDEALLERLRSGDRATLYAGVEQAFGLPATTEQIAARLPSASAALFHDHCPSASPGDQLEAYRAEKAVDDARVEQYEREEEERAKKQRR